MKKITKDQYEEMSQMKTDYDELKERQNEIFFAFMEMIKGEDGEEQIYYSDLGWATDFFDNDNLTLDEMLERLEISVEK